LKFILFVEVVLFVVASIVFVLQSEHLNPFKTLFLGNETLKFLMIQESYTLSQLFEVLVYDQ